MPPLPDPVVATYDDNPDARRLTLDRGIGIRQARMRSTHHADLAEVLLTRHIP